MKQHHSQAILALVFCCLSANLLLNFAQQKLLQHKQSSNVITLEKTPSSPKLVWLMSFPNSGTSYTLREMERLSNSSMATNYGSTTIRTELVFPDLPHGPRCRGLSDQHWPRPLPEEYVLVKTHCTGYATNEGAAALKRNRNEFVQGCATTRPNTEDSVKGVYDTSLVHKAVHVIRNPFHNLISRFNCEHKLMAQRGEDKAHSFAEQYPRNAQGKPLPHLSCLLSFPSLKSFRQFRPSAHSGHHFPMCRYQSADRALIPHPLTSLLLVP